MISTSSATRVASCSDGLALAEICRSCIVIWRANVTRERFERQRSALEEIAARYGSSAGFLCVIEPTAPSPPPSDELRRASADMIASYRDGLGCVAVVIEGEGFRAALTRGILQGMKVLLPKRVAPIAFFSSVRKAVAWMGKFVPIGPPADFAASVEYLRSHLDATQANSTKGTVPTYVRDLRDA
jgi:hypothetical protein